ncbi:MAG: AAA family ATPase [Candidatus Thermoplasmatota archaeon]|jgi:aminoglycoside phosphotransferase family enzyme/predicted kinase|nr:AAA family ATPase [Candidatus Thermoplasmatota archaeon]
MEQSKIVEHLKNPKFYGHNVKSVEILQTHISYVALTGSFAYKIKKPVNFGFLDFSTLEKRKFFCEEEKRLNKRLCPDIYLDVLPITQMNNKIELNGKGEIVEYTLKMKEFPQEQIMTNLLKQGKINEETIDRICTILVDFYNSQENTEEITKYGELKTVKQNIDENFEQTKPFIDITIPKNTYWYIKEANKKFFEKKKELFGHRMKEGCIKDCHGDLHSGNIVVSNDKIHIFDCIEFNKRFRFCDVASDIAFLAMDLDYLNHPYLSSYLIQRYVEKSNDNGIFDVLNFYKSYRAYVRGKVNSFQLNDQDIDSKKKNTIIETAKKYFELSQYYASLFSLDLHKTKPLLFLVCGLTGTGKSTVAQKIAVDYHAHQINTDVVRKELAGIDKFERHHDKLNTGLYDPKKVGYTYEKVMEKASDFLKKGENVVLDATFQKKKYREMAHQIAAKNHSKLMIIHCVCTDDVVRKRLEQRLKKRSVSDGRWEIYVEQKKTFEPFTSDEKHFEIDTSNESYNYRMNFFKTLVSNIGEVM